MWQIWSSTIERQDKKGLECLLWGEGAFIRWLVEMIHIHQVASFEVMGSVDVTPMIKTEVELLVDWHMGDHSRSDGQKCHCSRVPVCQCQLNEASHFSMLYFIILETFDCSGGGDRWDTHTCVILNIALDTLLLKAGNSPPTLANSVSSCTLQCIGPSFATLQCRVLWR